MRIQRFALVFALLALAGPLAAQQEVYIKVSEGMPMISFALPEFVVRSASPQAREAATTIHGVLGADLKYSRVFQLLPKEYYGYIRPLNPEKIFFKDWDGIQARFLLAGEVFDGEGGSVIFEGKVYDVKGERFIFGKRYQADKSGLRLVAHKMADEIMKMLAGEPPVFTSKSVFVSNRDGNDEIYLMDYDGANPTRLTYNKVKDYMPALSPDGTMVAYTSYRQTNAVLVLRSIYEGRERIIAARNTNFSPAFSPDGKRLAFCSTMDGNSEIYVYDLETGRSRRLTYNSAIDTSPSWSPTGRELAFTSDRTGTGMPQIYLMDAEGSNIRKVSFGGNYHDAPAWSPTGDRIVFVSRVENFFDLYSLNLRTNQIIKLTETSARNESPNWSPDGRHILFASNQSGSIQIYTVDYDGANMRRLTDRGENKLPNWTN